MVTVVDGKDKQIKGIEKILNGSKLRIAGMVEMQGGMQEQINAQHDRIAALQKRKWPPE